MTEILTALFLSGAIVLAVFAFLPQKQPALQAVRVRAQSRNQARRRIRR